MGKGKIKGIFKSLSGMDLVIGIDTGMDLVIGIGIGMALLVIFAVSIRLISFLVPFALILLIAGPFDGPSLQSIAPIMFFLSFIIWGGIYGLCMGSLYRFFRKRYEKPFAILVFVFFIALSFLVIYLSNAALP